MTANRVLDFRPTADMSWEITASTTDTGGEYFETTNSVGPRMGGPPEHVHGEAQETYVMLEGELEVSMNGSWRLVRAGESITIPPGTQHTLRNPTDEMVRLVNTHRPALRFEQFFREMHGLIASGRVKGFPPKDPRSALYLAMLFAKYSELQRTSKPPQPVFTLMARLGQKLRLKV